MFTSSLYIKGAQNANYFGNVHAQLTAFDIESNSSPFQYSSNIPQYLSIGLYLLGC
jgi:hypothetical protein